MTTLTLIIIVLAVVALVAGAAAVRILKQYERAANSSWRAESTYLLSVPPILGPVGCEEVERTLSPFLARLPRTGHPVGGQPLSDLVLNAKSSVGANALDKFGVG
jgi:hypothetical protein